MAMEFFNLKASKIMSMNKFILVSLLFGFSVLQGCGSSLPKPDPVYTPKTTGQAVDTLTFIPQLKVDKEGKTIPYEATENPYLKKRGKVDKLSVEKFIIAKRAVKSKDYDTAEKSLNDIIAVNKKISGPWVMLSDIALEQNDPEKAEQYLSRAIAINKHNVNAYLRLAKVKRILGQFKQAQQTYYDALSLWPDFPEAHLNLGLLYDIYMNETVKAQKHVEAYQFLTHGSNEQVAAWLEEIQNRTGVPADLNAQHIIAQGGSVTLR
jgi:tetratricopeptide (TPR) repeat protein